MRRTGALLVLCGAIVGACRTKEAPPVPAMTTTTSAVTADAGAVESAAAELVSVNAGAVSLRPGENAPAARQTFPIPAGSFASGSLPGEEGRVASLEPAVVPVKLGGYAIDALPYPNDPTAAPTFASSAAEAARLCAESGARLCTELEWEHACKGPADDAFATGTTWNPECDRTPSRCASGFGARGMGFLPEWVDGDVPIRGRSHRCAARSSTAKTSAVAVRCCHGERSAATPQAIELGTAFKKTDLEAADLAKVFESVPELARIREGVRLFTEPEVKAMLTRSSASFEGITFGAAPVAWNPEPGVELLVATGRAQKTGFFVALWALPGGRYRFASAFLLLRESSPVVLAYEPARRKELRWTSCWGCAGEQGSVSLRDDGRVVIVQH